MEISVFNKKIKLPEKFYWREVLAVLLLLIGIYFFHHQRKEVSTIIPFLHQANGGWLLTAALVTIIYILFQSGMYVNSFAAIGQKLSLSLCIELFLKRSFLSVFLPGGGVSALVYIPKNIKNKIKDKLVIYQASALFGFAGVLSTFIISLVVLFTSFGSKQDTSRTTSGLILLSVFILLLFYLMYTIRNEKALFKWLQKKVSESSCANKRYSGSACKRKCLYNGDPELNRRRALWYCSPVYIHAGGWRASIAGRRQVWLM